MKLLLVEDDKDLAQGLGQALRRELFVVSIAASGNEAIKQLSSFEPDLVVLDLGLPDMDGTAVLRHLRDQHKSTPVLILTARSALHDKVSALDLGADDYLAKPFEMAELLARLRVMSRRLGTSVSSLVSVGEVSLDAATHTVWVNQQVIPVPKKEFMTLKVLMESAGRVNTKDMLESSLYHWGEEIGSNTIEVHVSNLRKKLPEGFIKTIRGVGYTIRQTKS